MMKFFVQKEELREPPRFAPDVGWDAVPDGTMVSVGADGLLRPYGRHTHTDGAPIDLPSSVAPWCCGQMRPAMMGGLPTSQAWICNRCERYQGPRGARTPGCWWQECADGQPAWKHALGDAFDGVVDQKTSAFRPGAPGNPAAEPARFHGTRTEIIDALHAVPGVTYAEVIDCKFGSGLAPGEVAIIVHGGDPGRLAMALYESLPEWAITLGDVGMCLSTSSKTTEMRWYTVSSVPQHLLDMALAMAGGPKLDALGNAIAERWNRRLEVDCLVMKRVVGVVVEDDDHFRERVADPLQLQLTDAGDKPWARNLARLLFASEQNQRDIARHGFTPAQRDVLSAWHSFQLHERVAAAEATRKASEVSVYVQINDD